MISKISNNDLIAKLKDLVNQERKLLSEILDYLQEVESRKLHLQLGYPSLFEFCVRHLQYSEGSAQRRISAMRIIKAVSPESKSVIEEKINQGSLNLSHLSKAQEFFNPVE